MNKILLFVEQAFTVIALMLYSGGPLIVIISGGYSQGGPGTKASDNPIMRLIFFLTYIVIFFLIFARWKKVLYLLRQDHFIWLLISITLASVLWSDTPQSTLMRGIAIAGTSMFGLYLASRYTIKQQLHLLGWMFGLAIALSLIYALVLPQYGLMGGTHAGTWRGIYVHKNILGKVMVPSAIVFLLLTMAERQYRWLLALGLGLSVMLILLCTSLTSLVNLITILALFLGCHLLRYRYVLMVPCFLAIVFIGSSISLWLVSNAEPLLNSMGKDLTLTGRTELWQFVVEMIAKKPWLGYGYHGFWQGWNSEGAYVWRVVGWEAPHAHNGLLDLLLHLGLLGLVVFILGFLASVFRSLVCLRTSRTPEFYWPILYLAYMVLANLTENTMLRRNDLFWVLYVAVTLSTLIATHHRQKLVPSIPICNELENS